MLSSQNQSQFYLKHFIIILILFSRNSRKRIGFCYQLLYKKLSMLYFFEGTFDEKLTVFVIFKLKYLTLWNMKNLHLGLISKVLTLLWGEAISLTQWKPECFNQIIPLFFFLFWLFFLQPSTFPDGKNALWECLWMGKERPTRSRKTKFGRRDQKTQNAGKRNSGTSGDEKNKKATRPKLSCDR